MYDGIVNSAKHLAMLVIDDEETLILEEKSQSKMPEKEKDPEAIKQNISHKPINYEKLYRLSEDFGKHFTPQQELSVEQAFWLRISNSTIESSNKPPVKVEVPVCQSNTSVLNTKTVNAVNDGLNIVCVSCGKDVFMLSHEKCVARYALSIDSRVKRALFTTPVAAKSKNLGATSVITKSRLSVAKTPKSTNKVSSALSLSPDSSQSRTLSIYMKNKIATSQK
ncbi:hypothetical protein Tco_1291860 [Tanacetum coccineum]